jgi:hypothetical protein
MPDPLTLRTLWLWLLGLLDAPLREPLTTAGAYVFVSGLTLIAAALLTAVLSWTSYRSDPEIEPSERSGWLSELGWWLARWGSSSPRWGFSVGPSWS